MYYFLGPVGPNTPDTNPPVTVSAVMLGQARRRGHRSSIAETAFLKAAGFAPQYDRPPSAIDEQEDHQTNPALTFAAGTWEPLHLLIKPTKFQAGGS